MEGIIGINSKIKKIKWDKPSVISFLLEDGRTILFPTFYLPRLKIVKKTQRNKAQIINGNMFTWKDCLEVYHLEQVLGKEKAYAYNNSSPSSMVAEP